MFYFKDDKQVTVYFENGDIGVWKAENKDFNKVIERCEKNEWIQVETLHNQAKMLLTGDEVKVERGGKVVVTKGKETTELDATNTDDPLLNMIALLQKKGVLDDNIEAVRPFLTNMLENPYIDAVHELYEYCKAMDFEITEDGCFLAYKYVNKNLTSCYDSKTLHAIGKYTEVAHFDTDRRNLCSNGLHFCSRSYLGGTSDKTIIVVKINPKDVVSIPTDYNFAKGRCKRYMMVGYIAEVVYQ